MTDRLAIFAGRGDLPGLLADAADAASGADQPPVYVLLPGADAALAPAEAVQIVMDMNRWGALFDALRAEGVTQIAFAGGIARPAFDPAQFDAVTGPIIARVVPALQQGDDGLLRLVIEIFEEQGFTVTGPHEIAPQLFLSEGDILGRDLTEAEAMDAARGHEILAHLGPLDIGQGCVVAAGLCLGVETLQGTDAMLRFVADTPNALRRAPGVLVKGPKPGQDMRIDLPTIGPATIAAAAAAGLAGIVIPASGVLVLHRDAVEEGLAASGLFLAAL